MIEIRSKTPKNKIPVNLKTFCANILYDSIKFLYKISIILDLKLLLKNIKFVLATVKLQNNPTTEARISLLILRESRRKIFMSRQRNCIRKRGKNLNIFKYSSYNCATHCRCVSFRSRFEPKT